MFGLLKPDLDSLTCGQKSRYQRYYCGLCHAVGEHVGHAWRGLHSYDAIFVGLVCDALLERGAEPSSCRCPVFPVVHKDTHDPASVAMRYAVGVQMLLGDQWLADKAVDGSKVAQMARPVLAGPVRSGRQLLRGLGAKLDDLADFEVVQHDVERHAPWALDAAEPTAMALGAVFKNVAALPGAPSESADLLRDFGRHLGRLIYGLDALEDLVDDAVQGEFNPCLTADGAPDAQRTQQVVHMVRASCDGLRKSVACLPWVRNEDLVSHSVRSLCERASGACGVAEEHVSESGLLALRSWIAQPRYLHVATALLIAASTLWIALGTSAQAAGRGLARLLPGRQVQACPCDNCGKCCDGCTKCGDGCGDGCDQCSNGCDQCNNSCRDCNNCCSGCTWALGLVS